MEPIAEEGIDFASLPKHIAIRLGNVTLEEKKRLDFFTQRGDTIRETIKFLISLKVPIQTYYLSSLEHEELAEDNNFLEKFFSNLLDWQFIHDNQIKVSLIGRWFQYPTRIVEPMKKMLESTKDYDKYFVNFCLNYDGKEELVAAAKLIGYQVRAGKLDPDQISDLIIKENIYNSYFLPPDLMLIYGHDASTGGFLLWDSGYTKIHFMNKPFTRWEKADVYKLIS